MTTSLRQESLVIFLFETQDNPFPEGGSGRKFTEEMLGTPKKVLSEEEANKLMEEISQEEVYRAIR